MVVANKQATESPANKGKFTPPGGPTYTMTSTVTKKGDGLNLHVELLIENKTSKTFVFPKREIVLVIERDGKSFDTLKTTGEGFSMTPGGKMTGKFDRPISKDGTYTWQAKTWFFEK